MGQNFSGELYEGKGISTTFEFFKYSLTALQK